MKKITFDLIHTKTKQNQLLEMMHGSAIDCHALGNRNAKRNTCPVCSESCIEFYTTKFDFNLDRCQQCDQIFCNPMPTHEQLDCYYNGPMKDFENDFFEESFENRIPIFEHRINVISHYVKSGKLLDVGSAIGIFVEALKRSNTSLEINCCDPSKDACKRLSKRFPNYEIHECWLQQMDNSKQFDAITLWDTIEHIESLDDFVGKIFELLKPGGYWFFSTPNTHSFEWEIAGDDHVQLLPPGHINLFNKKSAEILVRKYGFELIEIQTPNGSLDVSYIEKQISNHKYQQTLGSYLSEHLKDVEFREGFAELISKTTNAGNIFVTARKPK